MPVLANAHIDISSCPDLQSFKPSPYLKIASELQSLKKDEAITLLREWSKNKEYDEQIIILCRMLFEPRKSSSFTRPGLGGPQFYGGTSFEDWPLEPITLVDDIPFDIVIGYILAGMAEPGSKYLEYCIKETQWTSRRYRDATDAQINSAFQKLLNSHIWKKRLSDWELDLLKKQIQG